MTYQQPAVSNTLTKKTARNSSKFTVMEDKSRFKVVILMFFCLILFSVNLLLPFKTTPFIAETESLEIRYKSLQLIYRLPRATL